MANAKNEPKEETQASKQPAKAKFVPKIKNVLTKPLLKLEIDQTVYVQIKSIMREGKELKGRGDAAKMKPAMLCDVINLETGQANMEMICPTIVQSTLNENYPDNGYVDKGFMITKMQKRSEEKSYFPYDIQEIEV